MTVEELIAKLQKLNPHSVVCVRDCDRDGWDWYVAEWVDDDEDDGEVRIG